MRIIPSNHNPSFFWPDSFAQSKYLDNCIASQSDVNNRLSLHIDEDDIEVALSDEEDDEDEAMNVGTYGSSSTPTASGSGGASGGDGIGYYGDEYLIDCNVIEIAKAKYVPITNTKQSIKALNNTPASQSYSRRVGTGNVTTTPKSVVPVPVAVADNCDTENK